MKNRIVITLALAALIAASTATAAHWKVLGTRVVTDRQETDTFVVGPRFGTLETLRLDVQKAPIEIRRIAITYANGDREVYKGERIVFRHGNPTIDLAGNERLIASVSMTYEAVSPGFERSRVRLLGR